MVFTQEPQCQTATPPLFILVSRFCHRSSKCTWHTGLLQSSPAFSWGRYPNGSCIYWRFWLWCVQSCHHKLGPSPESWDTWLSALDRVTFPRHVADTAISHDREWDRVTENGQQDSGFLLGIYGPLESGIPSRHLKFCSVGKNWCRNQVGFTWLLLCLSQLWYKIGVQCVFIEGTDK